MAVSRPSAGKLSPFVNPDGGLPLQEVNGALVDQAGGRFPIIGGIPRLVAAGDEVPRSGEPAVTTSERQRRSRNDRPNSQWHITRQLWLGSENMAMDVLEVGSGKGELTREILERTKANVYSIEPSNSVEANWRNNVERAEGRLVLAQALPDRIPFPDERFDKVLCFGPLEHTPDFESMLDEVVRKAKAGGEIMISFMPERSGWLPRKLAFARRLGDVMALFVNSGASVTFVDVVGRGSRSVTVVKAVRWLYPHGPEARAASLQNGRS